MPSFDKLPHNPSPPLPFCALRCTCFVLPSSDFPLPLLLRIFLAAGLELAYLHQPRRFHTAGLAKVCVTEMKDIFLYWEDEIITFNALFQTTLKPQEILISHPTWKSLIWEAFLFLPRPPYALPCFLSLSPFLFSSFLFLLLFLFHINISGCFLIPEYSPFSSWWH